MDYFICSPVFEIEFILSQQSWLAPLVALEAAFGGLGPAGRGGSGVLDWGGGGPSDDGFVLLAFLLQLGLVVERHVEDVVGVLVVGLSAVDCRFFPVGIRKLVRLVSHWDRVV